MNVMYMQSYINKHTHTQTNMHIVYVYKYICIHIVPILNIR